MSEQTTTRGRGAAANGGTVLSIDEIVLDGDIYPRDGVDGGLAEHYAELLRDGRDFPPIEVERYNGHYRILDGAHRWSAHKEIGSASVVALIIQLGEDQDPLLYAASKAIGPRALTNKEARAVAIRAFERNPRIGREEIARRIGKTRQTVHNYLGDLIAARETSLKTKIYKLAALGIPQERIGERVGLDRKTVLAIVQDVKNLTDGTNAQLATGFTPATVAQKLELPEPLVWQVALKGQDDLERMKALGWGVRTWDLWNWSSCDERFGDVWPGRIPAQLVAHTLYYFTSQDDLVFDPMAGGGVVADTCLAMGRRCWSFDLADRLDDRPEIEPHRWEPGALIWPVESKSRPDLIFFDAPYFDKVDEQYADGSISRLSRPDYLDFFADFFALALEQSKPGTRLAFLNADWRDFQGTPAVDEEPESAITMFDYARLMEGAGWQITHTIDAPMSTERFNAGVVAAMQKRRILGVVRRTLLVARRQS